jgi:hypothetical protein
MEQLSFATVSVSGKQEYPMADRTREKLENDPNRNMRDVPGTFNPGNQAGKGAEEKEGRPPKKPGAPVVGEGAVDKAPGTNPGQTGALGGKGKQDAPQNQKR